MCVSKGEAAGENSEEMDTVKVLIELMVSHDTEQLDAWTALAPEAWRWRRRSANVGCTFSGASFSASEAYVLCIVVAILPSTCHP